MTADGQFDLLSDTETIDLVMQLTRDFHDDLPGRVRRLQYLLDLGAGLGAEGSIIPGGYQAYTCWQEARHTFVYGDFAATVVLAQAYFEGLLGANNHMTEALDINENEKTFVHLKDILNNAKAHGVISKEDEIDILLVSRKKNALAHFKKMSIADNLERRAMNKQEALPVLLERDASFALKVMFRVLSRQPFRLDR